MDYQPPVDQLLTLGEPEPIESDTWPDYLAMGLGHDNIPELIRMAQDQELRNIYEEIYDEDDPTFHAPLHAIYALGQLRAESAIEPLLGLLDRKDDEWIMEDVPTVLGMIGPAAIPAITAYLADTTKDTYSRLSASNGLVAIAQRHPENRDECIAVITRQLEQYEENDEELNGFLIADLVQLKATETLPLIEQIFQSDKVDEFVINLDYVLEEFGLKERKEPPADLEELLSKFTGSSSKLPESHDLPAPAPQPTPASLPEWRPSTGMHISSPTKFSGKNVGGKKKAKKGKRR